MERGGRVNLLNLLASMVDFLVNCLFHVLRFGPIPCHIAFILDGNRRYAREQNLKEGAGHRIGFLALLLMLRYCCELGVKYMTVYAFSIDNFKRRPEQVQYVMDLVLEKIETIVKEESIVNHYGVKVVFLGNLKLLDERVRAAAEKAMAATARNNRVVLLVCVAYTSSDEIVHAAKGVFREKLVRIEENGENQVTGRENLSQHSLSLVDLEKHMYFGPFPDPEILIRTSGESRMSNFILWQSTFCYLNNPKVLWPDISLWHLV